MTMKYKNCLQCNKEFTTKKPSHLEKRKYCSQVCYKAHPSSPETRMKWSIAMKKNPVKYWLGKKRDKEVVEKMAARMRGNKFALGKSWDLSMETRKKMSLSSKRGPEHHNWKGGLPERLKKRMTFEYKLWREAVFKRDSFTCKECCVIGGKLNAHHIKPFSLFPELIYAIDNGVTLCVTCHRKTDTYGLGIKNYIKELS